MESFRCEKNSQPVSLQCSVFSSHNSKDKFVFKFFYDDPSNLRRVQFPRNNLSYDKLFSYCLLSYNFTENDKNLFSLRYIDNENESVTIKSD